jgi:hypothetical protein
MNNSQELRKNAENCVELAQAAESKPKQRRFERLAEGWSKMADAQAWLDGEKDVSGGN